MLSNRSQKNKKKICNVWFTEVECHNKMKGKTLLKPTKTTSKSSSETTDNLDRYFTKINCI